MRNEFGNYPSYVIGLVFGLQRIIDVISYLLLAKRLPQSAYRLIVSCVQYVTIDPDQLWVFPSKLASQAYHSFLLI